MLQLQSVKVDDAGAGKYIGEEGSHESAELQSVSSVRPRNGDRKGGVYRKWGCYRAGQGPAEVSFMLDLWSSGKRFRRVECDVEEKKGLGLMIMMLPC